MNHPPPVSAYMLTCNNSRTVKQALDSIAWADEIVVVDSGSTDGTLDLVRQAGAKLVQRAWPGFRDQYQFAADACTHQWAVFIDADEVIPAALADEMRRRLAENLNRPVSEQAAGFVAPRRTWYIDRWIRHGAWASDQEMRLYDRTRGAWKGGLHACIHVDGPVGRLDNAYLHYTYADIADHVDTLNRYSSTGAAEMDEQGKKSNPVKAVSSAAARFVRDYFIKGGFLDGFPGLVIAAATVFSVFVKHAKCIEIQTKKNRG